MRSTAAASDVLREGLTAIETEFALPTAFPAEVDAAAAAATADLSGRVDLRTIPFVTLDPAASTDLDQAFAITGDGSDLILSYAIADVGAFVPVGSVLDVEAWGRGVTVYLPHRRVPQYPPALSERAASLLPDGDRPAVVFTVAIAADGSPSLRDAQRAVVRSRSKRGYETTDPADIPLLAELARRAAANDAVRGAQRVEPPEQEIIDDLSARSGIGLQFRARRASESANAALSLACNMAVAATSAAAGVGLFRDLAEPNDREIASLRRVAAGFGIAWEPGESLTTLAGRLDPAHPRDATLQLAARRAGGGARYRFYENGPDGRLAPSTRVGRGPIALPSPTPDSSPQGSPWHAAMAAPYVHATAPLRRLADRSVVDLAVLLRTGGSPTNDARDRLAALPAVMARADGVAARVERACLDLAETVLLRDRVGELFDAVVVDTNKDGCTITVAAPAVRARLSHTSREPGDRVRVRLTEADPETRTIRFEPAS